MNQVAEKLDNKIQISAILPADIYLIWKDINKFVDFFTLSTYVQWSETFILGSRAWFYWQITININIFSSCFNVIVN